MSWFVISFVACLAILASLVIFLRWFFTILLDVLDHHYGIADYMDADDDSN